MTIAARRACPTLIVLATLAAGCAHAPRPEVLRAAGALDCEAAAAVAAVPPPHPRSDRVRRAVTAPASWALVGTAYVADFTLTAVGGLGAGAALCFPLLVLEGSLGGSGEASGQCIGEVAGAVMATGGVFDLGNHATRATRRWRCLDRTGEARELLAAAGCLRGRGGPGDEAAARWLLSRYAGDPARLDCTPHRERRAIERALEEPGGAAAGDTRTPEAGAPGVQDDGEAR